MNRSLALVVALLVAVASLADSLPASERAKIETLLAAVEALPGATFVRNGKAYKPATAAKFLRGKWDDRAKEIRSADDFIAKVATKSSTTGRPYLVRFRDGREVPTAEYFRAELAKLR